jgi:hypothetical protein
MNDAVEHYVLTMHPHAREVLIWVFDNNLPLEVHLNRTRFWVPRDSSLNTYFHLWLADYCGTVDPSADLATGLKPTASSN